MKRAFFYFILIVLTGMKISIVNAQEIQEVVYEKYRTFPQDSSWINLLQLLKQQRFNTADSLFNSKTNKLFENNKLTDYLFYANEYSYGNYLLRRDKEANLIINEAIQKIEKLVLKNDIEKLIAFYNASIYETDYSLKTQWLHLLLDNYSHERYPAFGQQNLELGSYYFNLGEYNKAWKYWDKCRYELNPSPTQEARIYGSIAEKIASHDIETAILFMEKAIEIINSIDKPDLSMIIHAYSALSELYIPQGSYEKSISSALKSIELLNNNKDYFAYKKLNIHSTYTFIIDSYIRLKNYNKPRFYVNKMYEINSSLNYPRLAKIRTDWQFGVLLVAENKIDSSLVMLNRSTDSLINLVGSSLHFYLANSYWYTGEAYYKGKNYVKAIDYYEKSLKAICSEKYSNINDSIVLIPPNELKAPYITYVRDILLSIVHCYKDLYELEHDQNYLHKMLELSNYINEINKFHFRGIANEELAIETSYQLKYNSFYGVFAAYHLAKTNSSYIDTAFIFSDLARSFNLNYKSQIASLTTDSNSELILQDIVSLRNKIDESTNNSFDKDSIFELKYNLYRKKTALTENSSADIKFVDNSSCSEIVRSNLNEKAAAIQYFVNGDSVYIICYTKSTKKFELSEIENLSNQTKLLTRAIKTGNYKSPILFDFYNKLINPISSELKNKNQLYIFADEQISGIPFSLLQDGENNFLLNNYNIKYYYSGKSFSKSNNTEIKDILIMAPGFKNNANLASNYVSRSVIDTSEIFRIVKNSTELIPLPYSLKEANEIKKVCKLQDQKAELITGQDATETFFKENAYDYDILHIATHGIAGNKTSTGLFFSHNAESFDDGFLRLNELYHQKINADLVVLSACKTGTGKIVEGEGVMALPRGFIYAGVPNVIASLWKVHDERTKDLMVAFYKHLLEDKVSYAEALRRAKLDCIKKGFLPIDWAGFILIGS